MSYEKVLLLSFMSLSLLYHLSVWVCGATVWMRFLLHYFLVYLVDYVSYIHPHIFLMTIIATTGIWVL